MDESKQVLNKFLHKKGYFKNLTDTIIFINFKLSYDSNHRENMIKVSKSYDIPDKIKRTIKVSYGSTPAIKLIHLAVYLSNST